MCVGLASATRASLARGDGCDSSAAVERLLLADLKAANMAVDHCGRACWGTLESLGEGGQHLGGAGDEPSVKVE